MLLCVRVCIVWRFYSPAWLCCASMLVHVVTKVRLQPDITALTSMSGPCRSDPCLQWVVQHVCTRYSHMFFMLPSLLFVCLVFLIQADREVDKSGPLFGAGGCQPVSLAVCVEQLQRELRAQTRVSST